MHPVLKQHCKFTPLPHPGLGRGVHTVGASHYTFASAHTTHTSNAHNAFAHEFLSGCTDSETLSLLSRLHTPPGRGTLQEACIGSDTDADYLAAYWPGVRTLRPAECVLRPAECMSPYRSARSMYILYVGARKLRVTALALGNM